jgi:sulfite reductase (ferredoxin)
MNGCPNSCAQHWIADIGLRGMRKERETGSEEGFTICVGGGLEGPGYIASPSAMCPATEVVPTVRRLLQHYVKNRTAANEKFGAYARRVGAVKLSQELGNWCPAPATGQRPQPALSKTFDEVISETSPW